MYKIGDIIDVTCKICHRIGCWEKTDDPHYIQCKCGEEMFIDIEQENWMIREYREKLLCIKDQEIINLKKIIIELEKQIKILEEMIKLLKK